ncbi:unnamed protein product, partial [Rotaria sp. Silwood1]
KPLVLFDYPLSMSTKPPKPTWTSKRLPKLQERRPITDPTFIFLNPTDMASYTSPDIRMNGSYP